MRLVIVSAAYPSPAEAERAIFVENLTRALAAQLGAARGAVRVVAPRVHASDPLAEERAGIDVVRFRYPGGGRRLKEIARPSLFLLASYAVAGFFATWRAVRGVRPRVLLAHWVVPSGPLAALVALLARIPLVIVAHGSDVHVHGVSSPLRRRLSRWALGRARRVVAVSAAIAAELERTFAVPARKITLLPMGIDDVWFSAGGPAGRAAARRALALGDAERVLLFAGDVTREKGIEELLAATARLDGVTPWRLVVIGDGPLRGRPVHRLPEAGADAGPPGRAAGAAAPSRTRVSYLGRLPPARLALWYRAADLFVLPSHGEGTPVSMLEALACGLPVVATRVGGIPDVVADGREGRLVPPRDAGALAAVLRELLASPAALLALRGGAAAARVPAAREQAARLALILEEAGGDG